MEELKKLYQVFSKVQLTIFRLLFQLKKTKTLSLEILSNSFIF